MAAKNFFQTRCRGIVSLNFSKSFYVRYSDFSNGGKKSGELKDGKIWEGSYVKKNGVVRKRYSEGVAK